MNAANPESRAARILIVDDDMTARLFAREALMPAGFEILEADDGSTALPMIATSRPDLVILDVVMPVMDGFETCRAIRNLPGGQHLPVLIMTGTDDVESMNAAFDAGATDFANKGMVYQLPHRVRHLLRSKRMADELLLSQQYLQNAQRVARLGHWRACPQKGNVQLSQMAAEILGTGEDSGRLSWDELSCLLQDDERREFSARFKAAAIDGSDYRTEQRIVRADGGERIVDIHMEKRAVDGVPELFGIVQDITDSRAAEQRIEFLANYDRLTGLPNRAFLMKHLDGTLRHAARRSLPVGFLALELDNFKQLNETFGFAVGDELILCVSERLQACIRNHDVLARGGAAATGDAQMVARLDRDGFVIVVNGLREPADAAEIARRLMHDLRAPVTYEGRDYHLTASMGVSVYPRDGDDGETLLTSANLAMQQAKVAARHTVCEYRDDMHSGATRRATLTGDLRRATERGELSLVYQPQVCAQSGQLVGVEALLRWQHAQLGMVSPADFIPLAEESGLIVPIGDWVLETACSQLAAWRASGLPPFRVAINLAGEQLSHGDLGSRVRGLLERFALPASALELEITEGSLIRDVELSVGILNELRQHGVPVAVDDFGTGYSSLSYLKRFPVDYVKIDQTFIRDLTPGSEDAAITRAIIAMAHSLELKVVAEGVETQAQMDFLKSQRCDEIQGYLISKPVPAEQFAQLLREQGDKF